MASLFANSKSSLQFWQRRLCFVLLSALFIMFFSGCCLLFKKNCGPGPQPPPQPSPQQFTVAFVDTKNNVQVRYSTDKGSVWQKGTIANATANSDIAIAADDKNIWRMLAFEKAGDLDMRLGVGQNYTSTSSLFRNFGVPIKIAYAGLIENRSQWYAFYQDPTTKKLTLHLTDGQSLGTVDMMPSFGGTVRNDGSLVGSNIVTQGTQIYVLWGLGGTSTFQIAIGTIGAGLVPTWNSLQQSNLPPEQSFLPRLDTLSFQRGGGNFYMGGVRETVPQSGGLQAAALFIYSSFDGSNWTFVNKFAVHPSGKADFTVSLDGTVLAITWSGSESGRQDLYKISKGQLTKLNAGALFDVTPNPTFAIISSEATR